MQTSEELSISNINRPTAVHCERLEKAYQRVLEGWFPASKEVLHNVQQQFLAGAYSEDRDQLLTDLKQDLSIYLYVLRELAVKARNSPTVLHSPHELLTNASEDELREILEVKISRISWHSLGDDEHLGRGRLQQSYRCAAAAEILAESSSIDGELAFSCGTLRQLGLLLISWNYPHIYERAARAAHEDCDLDRGISKILGFLPVTLAAKFALECHFPTEVLASLYGADIPRELAPAATGELAEKNVQLFKICNLADTLVRINEPDSYPKIREFWHELKAEITRCLGSDGLTKLNRHCSRYPNVSGKSENENVLALPVDDNTASHGDYIANLIRANRHLDRCTQRLRDDLVRLYYRLKPDEVDRANLTVLFREIVPRAGFNCGCVYVVNPEERVLFPILTVGHPDSLLLRKVRLGGSGVALDPIAAAFAGSLPHIEEDLQADGSRTLRIIARIGVEREVGVLYLERPETANEQVDGVASFQAIRQCLNDCLGV